MANINTLFDTDIGDVTGTIQLQALLVTGNVVVTGSVLASGGMAVTGPATVGGTLAVGGLGIKYAINPSINLTTATSAFVAAIPITAAMNVVVSVSFTSAGPVSLPTVASWLGGQITVLNKSTNTVGVWPQPNDIIDATATGAYVKLDSGKGAVFYGVSTTGILSAQIGTTAV